MPAANKVKSEPLSHSSPYAVPAHPSTTNTTSKTTPSKAWTGEEMHALFLYAVKHGAPTSEKGWEGIIPGRNGSQCRSAWRARVLPRIEKMFLGDSSSNK